MICVGTLSSQVWLCWVGAPRQPLCKRWNLAISIWPVANYKTNTRMRNAIVCSVASAIKPRSKKNPYRGTGYAALLFRLLLFSSRCDP